MHRLDVSPLLFLYIFFSSLLQRLRQLLKATPKWGPAHKVPKFDLESAPSGKTVTNPGFAGSSQNPFETRIWAPQPSSKLKRKPGKTNGHSQQVWSENKGNYFTLNKWNPRAKEVTSHNIWNWLAKGITSHNMWNQQQNLLYHPQLDSEITLRSATRIWKQMKLLQSTMGIGEQRKLLHSHQLVSEISGNYFIVYNWNPRAREIASLSVSGVSKRNYFATS